MFSHVTSLYWIDICCAAKAELVAPISPLTFCHQINFKYLSVTFVMVRQPERFYSTWKETGHSISKYSMKYSKYSSFLFILSLILCAAVTFTCGTSHLRTSKPKLLNQIVSILMYHICGPLLVLPVECLSNVR